MNNNLSNPNNKAVSKLDSYFQFHPTLEQAGAKIADKWYPRYNPDIDGWDDPSIPEKNITEAYWAYRQLQIENRLTDQQIEEGYDDDNMTYDQYQSETHGY